MSESSSSEGEREVYQDKKKKKGVRNFETYKNVAIKRAKIKGLAHENYAGKAISPRKTGESCK